MGLVHPIPDATPGYLRLPMRLSRGINGFDQSIRAMALGVAQSYPRSLGELAPRLTGPERSWPGSDELARDLVTLPTHSRLRPVEREEIVRMLCRAAE